MVLAVAVVPVAPVVLVAPVQTATQEARAMAETAARVDAAAMVAAAPVALVVPPLASGVRLVQQLTEPVVAVFYRPVVSAAPHAETTARPVCGPHTSTFSSSSPPLRGFYRYST